ncbi:rhamnulokinase [bacterium]|nr:rhamnulokinase [bacterium]
MSKFKSFLACDLGAESGRIIRGKFDGKKLCIAELHRFTHKPIFKSGTLYWDWDHILQEVISGIKIGIEKTNGNISGISCNSWAVDFGLLDSQKKLLSNPVSYRDHRTDRMPQRFNEIISEGELFLRTGTALESITTLCQLRSIVESNTKRLEREHKLLFISDLIHHALSETAVTDITMASASQMMNVKSLTWDREILKKLKVPSDILPDIVKPASIIGILKKEISTKQIPVIITASHDTTSAIAAIAKDNNTAFLSSGTWCMVGCEVNEPIGELDAAEELFGNFRLADSNWGFIRGIMGFWLIQQCRKIWEKKGLLFNYSDIVLLAEKSTPFKSLINPDNPKFLSPDDMIKAIQLFCVRTKQSSPTTPGEISRTIFESLAFDVKWTLEKIEYFTKKNFKHLHIVGGGCKNKLFCQLIADVTGLSVITGPAEATAIGNILLQLVATKELGTQDDIRSILENSIEMKTYESKKIQIIEEKYSFFKELRSYH